jgi:hypothetical protein
LSLKALSGLFCGYVILVIFTFIVFICELVYAKYRQHENPQNNETQLFLLHINVKMATVDDQMNVYKTVENFLKLSDYRPYEMKIDERSE